MELCLSEVSAVTLELQMFKLSPEVVVYELSDGRDFSIDGGELYRMCGNSRGSS